MPRITISPSRGNEGAYDITPGAVVGATELDGLSVEIRPKVDIERLLFLISYALDPVHWQSTAYHFGRSRGLVEALIPGFIFQARRTLRHGVLQGYRRKDEALASVKGRIRFEDQLRSRFGISLPVEVTHDDFTEDILPNRLLKAAASRLYQMRLRDRSQLRDLDRLLRHLERITLVEFPPGSPPQVTYSRLNEHYRPAVELARFIIQSTSYELGRGRIASRSFLVNMNRVFENFVVVAIREALGLSDRQFPQAAFKRPLFLDSGQRVKLEPDLSWWNEGRPIFVGDVKYKNLGRASFKHADLYQLLSYTIGTGLPDGLLLYAAGEAEPGTTIVPMANKKLHITTLDLSGSPEEILGQIKAIAKKIANLRAKTATA